MAANHHCLGETVRIHLGQNDGFGLGLLQKSLCRKPSSGSEDNVFFVGEPVRHLHEINIDKPQIVDGTNAIHGQFVTPKEPMIRKICSPSQVSYPLENSDEGLSTYQFNYPYAPCMVYLPT